MPSSSTRERDQPVDPQYQRLAEDNKCWNDNQNEQRLPDSNMQSLLKLDEDISQGLRDFIK